MVQICAIGCIYKRNYLQLSTLLITLIEFVQNFISPTARVGLYICHIQLPFWTLQLLNQLSVCHPPWFLINCSRFIQTISVLKLNNEIWNSKLLLCYTFLIKLFIYFFFLGGGGETFTFAPADRAKIPLFFRNFG